MDQEIISISVQKLGLNKNKRFYSYSVFEEKSFNNTPFLILPRQSSTISITKLINTYNYLTNNKLNNVYTFSKYKRITVVKSISKNFKLSLSSNILKEER